MNRHLTYPIMAAVAALGFIWAACSDAPTESPAELADPQFAKGGKPGPGTPSDAFPTIVMFRDDDSDNIRSDGRGSYEDGVCGVFADLGNKDDARMHPDAMYRNGKHRKTCGASRVIIIELNDPKDNGSKLGQIVAGVFSNIDKVLTVTGTNVKQSAGVFNTLSAGTCNQLVFNPVPRFLPKNGSDLLLVSFDDRGTADVADDVWTVRTQGFPNDKGFCSEGGGLFHMPFQMTIERQ